MVSVVSGLVWLFYAGIYVASGCIMPICIQYEALKPKGIYSNHHLGHDIFIQCAKFLFCIYHYHSPWAPYTRAKVSRAIPRASRASGKSLGSEEMISPVSLFRNLLQNFGSSRVRSNWTGSHCGGKGISRRRGSFLVLCPVLLFE